MKRSDFILSGGFDERFRGWGSEDTLMGAKAFALGNYIVPVYSAAGFHISHNDRSIHKTQEKEQNHRLYLDVLQMPFSAADQGWTRQVCEQVQPSFFIPSHSRRPLSLHFLIRNIFFPLKKRYLIHFKRADISMHW
ncbi:hypothetical protein EPA93_14835 [Ktedonosporobacter rubrisoli]|uniref:Galactosyltransferase C-terminal domain-containing protein n=2 Tax=Ktedonosporobacter rubrisoli TaxID=2509675 RepID=A0A4P6JPJ8_KTERU|nr:hypothetical protein EPA93_14835 [Ktedonosporobacter rubrisoli]